MTACAALILVVYLWPLSLQAGLKKEASEQEIRMCALWNQLFCSNLLMKVKSENCICCGTVLVDSLGEHCWQRMP